MNLLEDLLSSLRDVCAAFPDKRSGGPAVYTMADIGLSAISLFFMQSESFLSYQRALEEGHKTSNCQSLFGMTKIPTDNHIRSMLDPVSPTHLQPAFDQVLRVLQTHDGLSAFRVLDGRALIALDGTEYFCSQNLGCPCCQTRQRSNGKTERYHAMLAATLVAPGHTQVVPLMPEFITPQDGLEKQDGERAAARRWLAAHAGRVNGVRPVYLGDDLFACQPIAAAIVQTGADFIFVCKPQSHKALYDFIDGAPLQEVSVTERKGGGKRLVYRYRWIEAVPLRDGDDALTCNRIGVEIADGQGKMTYRSVFITTLAVSARQRRLIGRLWPGQVEDREWRFQRVEKQRLSSGA